MALYYSLVFGLLIVEIVFFTILSLPYPRKIRRTVLTTVSAPFRNEKFQIALKCILGFVLILFIDSVNRVFTVNNELSGFNPNGMNGIVNDRSEIQARRFYSQRNMYLCGFTLFLTMILLRTYSLVAELIVTKDKVDALSADGLEESKTNDSKKITALKEELAAKDQELELLKEKAESLSKDYDSETKSKVKQRKA
ncbi:endoplasmic reticulum transmembrane protein 3 [[Candida] jaroonii]|uniref:Endoplasmic reticulum transmembrane protein 3 n=1 Tax=[Candida] jaroonii TaxID=467808 RepID=A0ACA9YF35_9ASCO|nr:endoplasmic reticulum transmembrane protein 3 [[Candida] jaroonii]